MKFTIKKPGNENILNLMRRAGYYSQGGSNEKGETVFIRPMERSGYPRFHIYAEIKATEFIFNLHLDQKRPVYKGTAAHAGEYEGVLVENESERIKQSLL